MSNDAERISSITAELNGILEARLTELGAATRTTEAVTRQIISAELEISRYKQLQQSLNGEAAEIKQEAAALRVRADEVSTAHGGLLAERDKLRADVARLEGEARDGSGESDRLRARARALDAEVEGKRADNDGLRAKIQSQEDEVEKVHKLKAELKAKMAALGLKD